MAWSTPLTAVSNATLTAAQWNASVRDNLLETAAGKATTAGRHFVSAGANSVAERAIESQEIITAQTSTSTSYADLTTVGPTVTVTTGTRAIVFWQAQMQCTLANTSVRSAVAVSGASTVAAADTDDLYIDGLPASQQIRAAAFKHFTTLTGGSNTFKMMYKVGGGTGTWSDRQILVIGL